MTSCIWVISVRYPVHELHAAEFQALAGGSTCSTGVRPDQCVCASCSRGDNGTSWTSSRCELRTPPAMRAGEPISIRMLRVQPAAGRCCGAVKGTFCGAAP